MSKLTDYRIILANPNDRMTYHSPRVLMNAARRLRIPGSEYVECPPAVMALGASYCHAKLTRRSISMRTAAFWQRMLSRFVAAEPYAAEAYYRGSDQCPNDLKNNVDSSTCPLKSGNGLTCKPNAKRKSRAARSIPAGPASCPCRTSSNDSPGRKRNGKVK